MKTQYLNPKRIPDPVKGTIFVRAAELPGLDRIERVDFPNQVLMVPPTYYELLDDITNSMSEASSDGPINKTLALQQWESMRKALVDLGVAVTVVSSQPGLYDFHYPANDGLVLHPLEQGLAPRFIPARLLHLHRQPERAIINHVAKLAGYEMIYLAPELPYNASRYFEGQANVILVPGFNFAFANISDRTDYGLLERLVELTGLNLFISETTSYFYDLDTALLMIPNHTDGVAKPLVAFAKHGFKHPRLVRQVINAFFDRDNQIIPRNKEEMEKGMVFNSLGVMGQRVPTVLTNTGCVEFPRLLRDCGVNVVRINFSEIHRGGGSITCSELKWFGPNLPPPTEQEK